LFKQFRLKRKLFTYATTALIIILYPFALFGFEGYLKNSLAKTNCGNPQGLFVIGNTIIFLPIALLLQFVFNKILLKKTAPKMD